MLFCGDTFQGDASKFVGKARQYVINSFVLGDISSIYLTIA